MSNGDGLVDFCCRGPEQLQQWDSRESCLDEFRDPLDTLRLKGTLPLKFRAALVKPIGAQDSRLGCFMLRKISGQQAAAAGRQAAAGMQAAVSSVFALSSSVDMLIALESVCAALHEALSAS